MDRNPYQTPRARLADVPRRRPWSIAAAVAAGVALDITGTLAVSVVLGIVWSVSLLSGGVAADDIAEALNRSASLQWTGLLIGSGFTTAGAYLAARLAGAREYTCALLVGAISFALGELMFAGGGVDPGGLRLIGELLVIPAAMLGGHLRARQRAASEAR